MSIYIVGYALECRSARYRLGERPDISTVITKNLDISDNTVRIKNGTCNIMGVDTLRCDRYWGRPVV